VTDPIVTLACRTGWLFPVAAWRGYPSGRDGESSSGQPGASRGLLGTDTPVCAHRIRGVRSLAPLGINCTHTQHAPLPRSLDPQQVDDRVHADSLAALLLTLGSLAAYDRVTFRDEVLRDIDTLAGIIGENASSSVAFNDRQTAALKTKNEGPAPLAPGS
jgi:hypothetical protein